ncbi:MAG: GNAT family N-acetyltransferase [Candidatus Thorarchaeota archaeon]
MLDFFVGAYTIEEFKKYYCTLSDLRDFYVRRTGREPGPFELGPDEEGYIMRDPNHLIVWTDDGEIIGHCVWHETTTEEMIPGDPRDDDDRSSLHQLFGGEKDNLVELHELWMKTDHRGKGLGHQVFDFFEDYFSENGFDGFVYYTDHIAAINLCRKRGYEEGFLESSGWYVFVLSFSMH